MASWCWRACQSCGCLAWFGQCEWQLRGSWGEARGQGTMALWELGFFGGPGFGLIQEVDLCLLFGTLGQRHELITALIGLGLAGLLAGQVVQLLDSFAQILLELVLSSLGTGIVGSSLIQGPLSSLQFHLCQLISGLEALLRFPTWNDFSLEVSVHFPKVGFYPFESILCFFLLRNECGSGFSF